MILVIEVISLVVSLSSGVVLNALLLILNLVNEISLIGVSISLIIEISSVLIYFILSRILIVISLIFQISLLVFRGLFFLRGFFLSFRGSLSIVDVVLAGIVQIFLIINAVINKVTLLVSSFINDSILFRRTIREII